MPNSNQNQLLQLWQKVEDGKVKDVLKLIKAKRIDIFAIIPEKGISCFEKICQSFDGNSAKEVLELGFYFSLDVKNILEKIRSNLPKDRQDEEKILIKSISEYLEILAYKNCFINYHNSFFPSYFRKPKQNQEDIANNVFFALRLQNNLDQACEIGLLTSDEKEALKSGLSIYVENTLLKAIIYKFHNDEEQKKALIADLREVNFVIDDNKVKDLEEERLSLEFKDNANKQRRPKYQPPLNPIPEDKAVPNTTISCSNGNFWRKLEQLLPSFCAKSKS